MKVLITTDTYEPAINGVVTSVKTLASELRSRGHEVRIFAPASKTYVENSVYYMRSIPVGNIYPDARLATSNLLPNAYIKEIEDWNPDIIHSQTEFSTLITAKRIASVCNAPLVSTVHTYYEDYTHYVALGEEFGKRAVAAFMKLSLKDSAAVIVPSMKIARVVESYNIHAPVFCIPTGISPQKFDAVSRQDGMRIREKLGIPTNDFVFVTVGRVAEEKDQKMLVDAFFIAAHKAQATGKPFNASLLIVGDGPDLELLQSYVAEQQESLAPAAQGKVFFAGRVNPDSIASYYKAGDVFVNASTSETQGLTYLEALMSGLPLLVKMDPCLLDVLEHNKNGLAINTVDEMAARMIELCGNPTLTSQLAYGAQITAHHHSAHAFGQAVESLYERVLSYEHNKPRLLLA